MDVVLNSDDNTFEKREEFISSCPKISQQDSSIDDEKLSMEIDNSLHCSINENWDYVKDCEKGQNKITCLKNSVKNEETTTSDEKIKSDFIVSRINNSKEKIDELEINSMVPTQNAKSIGSLGLLSQYVSSSDEDTGEDSSEDSGHSDDSESECSTKCDEYQSSNKGVTNTLIKNCVDNASSQKNYRVERAQMSNTGSENSDIEFVLDDLMQSIDVMKDEELQNFLKKCDCSKARGPVKAKDELDIDDLPPIEELTITITESECVELGKIYSIVDTLVLVESIPNFAALDINTVLFLEKGSKTLGQVFDVMGNVASPIYCVRFNSAENIKSKCLEIGMDVYVAPQTKYTSFIVLSDLMKQKGCDASWENDHEVPDECDEFSDDENERMAQCNKNQAQRNQKRSADLNDQLSNKIRVKNEMSTPYHHSHYMNLSSNETIEVKNSPKFYRDNRNYNNVPSNYSQQGAQHTNHSHNWHSTGYTPQMSYGVSSHPASIYYPNPFAFQVNYTFNQHTALPQQLPTAMQYRMMKPNNK